MKVNYICKWWKLCSDVSKVKNYEGESEELHLVVAAVTLNWGRIECDFFISFLHFSSLLPKSPQLGRKPNTRNLCHLHDFSKDHITLLTLLHISMIHTHKHPFSLSLSLTLSNQLTQWHVSISIKPHIPTSLSHHKVPLPPR